MVQFYQTENTVSAASHKTGRVPDGLLAAPAPYWIMPAVSNITMAATSASSAHLTVSIDLMNYTGHGCANGTIDAISFSKIVGTVRVLGLMAVISYMTVILFAWIYANLQGYVYFSAGEPVLIVKYSEWVLGFLGIFAAVDCLRKELTSRLDSKHML